MKAKKKLQHFVARSYLRGFANNGALWGWFREPNEVRDVHVNTIAAEHGFYDVALADGTPCDDLEDALAVFDGMTPALIRSCVSDPRLSKKDVDGVRWLYATLLARNHQGRDRLVPEVKRLSEKVGEMYDEDFPSDPGRRTWAIHTVLREHFSLPDRFAVDPDTISRLNVLNLAENLMSAMPRNVCILRSKAQNFFTSDAPCAYFDPISPPRAGEVSGIYDFASDSLELTLPLDRRHAALIANRALPDKVSVNFDGVRVVNARTAFYAKRVILAYPENEESAAVWMAEVMTERTAFDTPLLAGFN